MYLQIVLALGLLWAARAIPVIANRTGYSAASVELGFAAVYFAAFLALYAVSGAQRPPLGALTAKRAVLAAAAGIGLFVVGMAAYSASFMLYSKMGWRAPGALAFFNVEGPGAAAALIVFISATVVLEEYTFRGVILPLAAQHYPAVVAVVISALCFSLYHLSGFQFAATFLWGLALAAMFFRTQSLVAPIIAHLTFNMLSVAMFLSGALPRGPN